MDKYEIAQILRELGIIIELIDVNPKKSIAYYRAARTVESVPNFLEIAQHQDLQSLPGIGKKNSQMVGTLLNKKKLPYYEHLKSQIPNDLLDLAQLPGINLKKLRSLYESLFVTNLDQLEQVLKEGKTLKMKGFGASYSAKLMNQTVFWKLQFHPSLYPKAQNLAQIFLEILRPHTNKIEVTGALRRKLETIDEVNLIATSSNNKECLDFFTHHCFYNQFTLGELICNHPL